MKQRQTIPYGYCECGCGMKTTVSPSTHRTNGYIRGEPRRFLHGHNRRGPNKPVRYKKEQRGYSTPCWIWQLRAKHNGYGELKVRGKYHTAHRWYFARYRGPIPEAHEIHHLCGSRDCVNPWHLEAISRTAHRRLRPLSHLTAKQASAIRNSTGPAKPIAAMYGINPDHVYRIRRGKRWNERDC